MDKANGLQNRAVPVQIRLRAPNKMNEPPYISIFPVTKTEFLHNENTNPFCRWIVWKDGKELFTHKRKKKCLDWAEKKFGKIFTPTTDGKYRNKEQWEKGMNDYWKWKYKQV